MALINCAQCLNEYDNHDANCPYCGAPTPSIQKVASKIPFKLIFFVAIFAVIYIGSNDLTQVKQWFSEYLQEDTEYEHIATVQVEEVAYPEYGSSPLTEEQRIGIENVDSYTMALAYELERIGSDFKVLAPSQQEFNNTFTYQLSSQTILILEYDVNQEYLEAVTLHDTQRSNFARRLGDVKGAVFLPMLRSSKLNLNEVNARIDYLLDMIEATPEKEASYELQRLTLSGSYDNPKGSVSIMLAP